MDDVGRQGREVLLHRDRQEGALLIAFRRWQVAVWNAGQAHWVSLASSAQLISVDHTSHNIQVDRPDVVLDKIHELLQ